MTPAAHQADTDEIRCFSCGRTNRVVRARLADNPICGACRQPLLPSAPVEVTDSTFHAEVESAPIPVLVDFWAPWCGPCRAIAPTLERIAAEWAGKVKVAKLNIDQNPRTAARFAVQAIPTMIAFKSAKVVDQIRGAVPKKAIEVLLSRL